MARIPLALPPGVFRNGTVSQSRGRWYNTYLVRWYGGGLGPIMGWIQRGTGTVSGLARAMITWRNNTSVAQLAIGTHSKLYAGDVLGNLYDITPVGFVVGRADAVASGGYGSGLYSAGTYGTPRPGTTEVDDATEWTLDTWGEDLIGVSPDDTKIYEWTGSTGTPAAQVVNSPTCSAIVVTAERFLFALGTDDPRTVDWCDQENNTVWTPSSTNQAGSFPLQTGGRLICGKNINGGTLLLTDTDVHLAQYIGGVDVYSFRKIGDGCGAISRQAAAHFDMQAAWMSQGPRFWLFNGYVREIPCDVLDYVQRDFNTLQQSKVIAVCNSGNSEIEWRYCSAASTEIDRCVVWNFATGQWVIGRIARTCGADRGTFTYPIMVDSSGAVWDHETGYAYSGTTPYAESGPVQIGNGDNVSHFLGLYPDDITVGDVTATFYVKNNNDDPEVTFGPYTLTSQTDLRITGRQCRMRVDGAVATNWRVGAPVLDIEKGGER